MNDEPPNWDVQLDRCLMNAAAALASSPNPTSLSESCELACTWLTLAEAWADRQVSEVEYQRYLLEAQEENA